MAVKLIFASDATAQVVSGPSSSIAPSPGAQETWVISNAVNWPTANSSSSPPVEFSVMDFADGEQPHEEILVTNTELNTPTTGEQTLTVTRGANSTTPVPHAASCTITVVLSAPDIEDFLQSPQNLSDVASASTALSNLGGLAKANNLSDVNSALSALANLGVPVWVAHAVATSNQSSLSGLPTIDAHTMTNNEYLLLVNQTAASQNGIWQMPASGSGSWVRPANFAHGAAISEPMVVKVAFGTSYAGRDFTLQTPDAGITIDTTAQTWILSGGRQIQSTLISSSNTWTVPFGVSEIIVEAIGGGGGGGGSASRSSSGNEGTTGGGGQGAYVGPCVEPVTPGDTITVTCGAGGGAGTAGSSSTSGGSGGTGGNTTVTDSTSSAWTITALGGGGGGGSTFNSGSNSEGGYYGYAGGTGTVFPGCGGGANGVSTPTPSVVGTFGGPGGAGGGSASGGTTGGTGGGGGSSGGSGAGGSTGGASNQNGTTGGNGSLGGGGGGGGAGSYNGGTPGSAGAGGTGGTGAARITWLA
jgi:hypothetical protein